MIWDALLLGLASGTSCVTTCAPVVLPWLFTENAAAWKENALRVGLMLAGRLIGYLSVGFIIGTLGNFFADGVDPAAAAVIGRVSHGAAGALLLLSGVLQSFPSFAPCRLLHRALNPKMSAFLIGLATGISLCPPFIAAATHIFGHESGAGGALYFALFFIGTSVWFLPLLGIPVFRKHRESLRVVARLSCILVGAYYILFHCVLGA